MSTEERELRAACHRHPGRTAVALCDGCGRPVCLSCAVPVRGEVYGPGCLPAVLGDDGPGPAAPPPRPSWVDRAARGATALALVGTLLPWTRFGEAAGPLGAWSASPRAATVASVASLLATLLALAPAVRAGGGSGRGARVGLVLLAATAALASVTHIVRAPGRFLVPAVGAWVTAVSATLATAGWAVVARRSAGEAEGPAG